MSGSSGTTTIPEIRVPRLAAEESPSIDGWDRAVAAAPFRLSDDSGLARHRTEVRLTWSPEALHVRFLCEDDDIWGRFRGRDEPLWEEEAVEIFLAPGEDAPREYFEFEFNPFGAVFDAIVRNPTLGRDGLRVDPGWDCPGLAHTARVEAPARRWEVEVAIPWRGLGADDPLAAAWRANFFRIERPRTGSAEFSAWSSPKTDPPDFHRPTRFGVLRLCGARTE